MRILIITSLFTFLFVSNTFAATPVGGFYIKAFGGITGIPDNVRKSHNANFYSKVKYRDGYDAGGTIGYKSGTIRYELEGTFVHGLTKQFNFNTATQRNTSGRSQAIIGMMGLYYDFEDINELIAPFIGAGIGYSHLSAKLNSTTAGVPIFSKTSNVFSYQATTGLTYNFSENYALSLAYRYIRTDTAHALGKRYQAHLGNLGVIYRFNELT